MKRVSILIVIVTMLGMGSCTSFQKSEYKTDIDTLSYYYGMSRADGIMSYLTVQAGVDTAYLEAFLEGLIEGVKKHSPKDVAYLEGMRIGQMINNQWVASVNRDIFYGDSAKTINSRAILTGFYQGVKFQNERDIMHAQSYSHAKIEEIREANKLIRYADVITASEKFLAENKNKEGVITTSSGLQYKIISEGKGQIPGEKSRVKIYYRGTLVDGTEFDSTNNKPSTFRIGQVIQGWTEALQLMPVGSKWELYIPQELAYGSREQSNIPPYSTLIFEIELVEIDTE